MQESEDTMSSECSENVDNSLVVKLKPKKRSIVERELETNLTEKITSPLVIGDGNKSRYGRSRRSKGDTDQKSSKSPKTDHAAYKMHASNSPVKINNSSPVKVIKVEQDLDNQIANIYNENIMLSRFGSDKKTLNLHPKVYVRKDLIQRKDKDDTVLLIKDVFSPSRSNSHLNNILERDNKFNISSKSPNDTPSVVKTLDFDSGKSRKREADKSRSLTKSELFEMEAKCDYQVGDLAWARMGTFPFWPCCVTRDPLSGMFVKKKMFGRIERDVIHVTFFGDNGRRGWIVENMLRQFAGLQEFEATKDKFTPEAKKKDPRLYAAFFVSEKRLPQWKLSIEEAETLQREPKRLRIDVYNDMLSRSRTDKTTPKSRGKVARADSDVSLSESLYDTLFSEDDGKSDDDKSKNKRKNKSFDVSDVVTACLDNMAAKTGITKIQRQSHMDRWLQKAKSKTPEKNQLQKLSKSLLFDKFPKKVEQDSKFRDSKSKRKSTSSIAANQKSQKNRQSLNRSANSNIGNYQSEDTNIINQTDCNHAICNGDIVHNIEINVDIPMNLTNPSTENEIMRPNKSDVTEKKETTTVHQMDEDPPAFAFTKISEDSTEPQLLAKAALKNEDSSVDFEHGANDKVNFSLDQDASFEGNGHNIASEKHDTDNQEVVIKSSNFDIMKSIELAEVISKNCEETAMENSLQDFTKMCDKSEVIDYSKINGHLNKQKEIQLYAESINIGCKISNNNYKNISKMTYTPECKVNGFIDHSNQFLNIVKDNRKSNEVDISKSEFTENNVLIKKQNISLVSKNNKKDLQAEVKEITNTDNDIFEQYKDSDVISISASDSNNKHNLHSALCSPAVTDKNSDATVCLNNEVTDSIIHKSSVRKLRSRTAKANSDIKKNVSRDQSTESKMKRGFTDNYVFEQCKDADTISISSGNSSAIQNLHSELSCSSVEFSKNKDTSVCPNDEETNSTTIESNGKFTDCKLRSRSSKVSSDSKNVSRNYNIECVIKDDPEIATVNSEISTVSINKGKLDINVKLPETFSVQAVLKIPEFLKYLELKQDSVMDENPELTHDDIVSYLYKSWQYGESSKPYTQKIEEIDASSLVKGINPDHVPRFRSKKRVLSVKLTRHVQEMNVKSFNNKAAVKERVEDGNETTSSEGSGVSSIRKLRSSASQSPSVNPDLATEAKTSDGFNHKDTLDDSVSITSKSSGTSWHNLPSRSTQSTAENDENASIDQSPARNSDEDYNPETSSIYSETSSISVNTNINSMEKNDKLSIKVSDSKIMDIPEFVKYFELNQDDLMEQNPDLTQDELITYLYKTWQYEESSKTETQKTDDIIQSNLVKGTNQNPVSKSLFRLRKRVLRVRLSNYSTESEKSCGRANEDDSASIASEKCENTTFKITEIMNNEDVIRERVIEDDEVVEQVDETTVSSEFGEQATKSLLCTQESKNLSDVKQNPTEVSKKSLAHQINTEENELIHVKEEIDDTASVASQSTDISDKLASKSSKSPTIIVNESRDESPENKSKTEYDPETASLRSEDSTVSISKKRRGKNETLSNTFSMEIALQIPEFVKYLELRRDSLIDENPELSHEDIVAYLYKTWLYEESTKSEFQKTDEIDQSNLVKGLNQEPPPQPKKVKKKIKKEPKIEDDEDEVFPKGKRKRNVPRLSYEEYNIDVEDEVQYFEIFKTKNTLESKKSESYTAKTSKSDASQEVIDVNEKETNEIEMTDVYDEVELYFQNLTKPKPNVFKGLVRERVCEICEKTSNLVKCKGCHNMFHVDCVNKAPEVVEVVTTKTRGRKKKKPRVRKPKNTDSNELDESHSDGKSQDHSVDETQMSVEDLPESKIVTNLDDFEAQLEAKMKEMLDKNQVNYDSYSSDELCWSDTEAGKCEIVDVKLKPRTKPVDLSDFKCKDCQKYDTPVCFVCKNAVSKTGVELKQKCNVAHCNKYYHLECLEIWPQTQFNSGEPSRNNKKINEHFEALTCPRHVCHTCVCDDPRGCKTRFSGDKLARCIRCPATYHSFTKCLPAGSQILTASHIICPRHYENRPGKVPCHVNTGWCFICALGGSLICCEYCPTSFHAECLNIKPPEGGYMCEDCETGRLPLYGEMIWVKLGHYRWWPGIILHPSEISENILAVKHSPGEFVVRFFGQYDHYWVNRGRVFPFQEGDSGRVSSQKSKIDADFTMAMEHAQRACEILKSAPANDEESSDIASSLLPPHYVKLKVNKPCGSLIGRRIDLDESSLTQCECDPNSPQPCGPYTHCLNRMLLTECGPTCRAGELCNNRAFEKRQYPKLVPYRTPYRGWGLKTLEMIPAGQFVIEYVGELIDEEEFRRRMTRQHEIRDENYYFLTLDKERMIDAGPKGNLARFMNHCCEPNCETQKWTVLGDVRVGLFAINDIPANSEVTFNYNFECVGIEKKKCLCGAKRCSGYIGAKPKQDESQIKKTPKVTTKRSYKKRKPEESPSTKRPRGRPLKPRELTDIEKDLLIIKNATNGISSDSDSGRQSVDDSKALKRKRVSVSTEEGSICNGMLSPSAKRMKLEDNASEG